MKLKNSQETLRDCVVLSNFTIPILFFYKRFDILAR